MPSLASKFDTNKEFCLQRRGLGIQLVRPNPKATQMPAQSISNIFNLPISSYFLDAESQPIDANDTCAQVLNAPSIQSILGKRPEYFSTKEFAHKILENNNTVMRTASMMIMPEMGVRTDFFVQAISFKFPWYYENRIIGIFGCSIQIDLNSFAGFSEALSHLIHAGLLAPAALSSTMILSAKERQQDLLNPDPPHLLTSREWQVLHVLAKGKTINKIAAELRISDRTVETHLIHIKTKLNLKQREDLVAFYWNNR